MSIVLGLLSVAGVIVFGYIALLSIGSLVVSEANGYYYNRDAAPLAIIFPLLITLFYLYLSVQFFSL